MQGFDESRVFERDTESFCNLSGFFCRADAN
jgi:hypothetical protein